MDNAKAIAELTGTLKKLTGATSLSDSRVSDLLSSWAASHPRARGALQRAAQQSLRGWLEKEQAAVLNRFASSLIPGDGACELLITMNAPKRAFRALSRYFSARMREFKAGSPFGPLKRPICSRAAFTEAWASFARALTLGHVEYREGPPLTVGLHWPLQRWAEYINSRPTLFNALDFSKPLHFIVRGDGYPTAGSSWAALTITLANFGEDARSPAYTWLIGLAVCAEKDIGTLGEPWKETIKVLSPPF